MPLVADALVLERGDEFFVATLEEIVLPASNPEQLQFGIRGSGIGENRLSRLRSRRGSTECAHPRETIKIRQPDAERLAAAHAEAGNGPLRSVWLHTVN